ncbi:GIY-YIG nuclease family protein [Rhizobium sp. MHM7A]|uniref:GIY-YIG nuclease family protein n=1 Tax=Rhizobium sp. MHM7A TaxID=2583233 RepID=UPI001106069B|nr:GIY-YIG nuclease family protein [Rhizobium sp. MHM7A]TLX17029.1 GIY-YIG nuclease family protein [Rhizobium sp. MHM7A]
MAAGFVYVLSNRSMPGMVKIGKTTRDPRTRAGELFASGVPTPFTIEATIETPNIDETESTVHRLLVAHRVNKKREFFHVSVPEAVNALRRAVDEGPGTFRPKAYNRGYARKGGVKDVPLGSAAAMTALLFPTISAFHPYAGYAWLIACASAASLGTPPIIKEYLAVLGKGFGLKHGVVSAVGVATLLPAINQMIASKTFVLSEIVRSYLNVV